MFGRLHISVLSILRAKKSKYRAIVQVLVITADNVLKLCAIKISYANKYDFTIILGIHSPSTNIAYVKL